MIRYAGHVTATGFGTAVWCCYNDVLREEETDCELKPAGPQDAVRASRKVRKTLLEAGGKGGLCYAVGESLAVLLQ